MEHSLTEGWIVNLGGRQVLILILMEHSLTGDFAPVITGRLVLILILMEHSLTAVMFACITSAFAGLNPYSNGTLSDHTSVVRSFNRHRLS